MPAARATNMPISIAKGITALSRQNPGLIVIISPASDTVLSISAVPTDAAVKASAQHTCIQASETVHGVSQRLIAAPFLDTASGHEKIRVCGQLAPGWWP